MTRPLANVAATPVNVADATSCSKASERGSTIAAARWRCFFSAGAMVRRTARPPEGNEYDVISDQTRETRTAPLRTQYALRSRIGNKPMWRPWAWFTRRDRVALREAAHVCGEPARLAWDGTAFEVASSGVSRPMCSCMLSG